ncbi:hypothetical protein C4F49_09205 [Sphingobacterium sp. KB22]|uniref:Uncharacterized protein n=2 Tax=Sphingobacterium hungaricum TaxID=2082723 RepID=A0A928UW94_9SPHI|nr:hypothetical protein [Sphingobacterium hungaricum]
MDLLDNHIDDSFVIILAHGMASDNSITELLGIHAEDHLDSLQSEDFIKACQLMCSKYGERIQDLYSDIITSENGNYFRNYCKGNRIDHVVVAENVEFAKLTARSFDLLHVFKKNKSKEPSAVYLDTDVEIKQSEDKIDSLFFRKKWNVTF